MSFLDDMLDFLGFIVLLGGCLAIGFGIVVPIIYDEEDISNQILTDKTAPIQKGVEIASSDYDGTMSKLEVAILTQVQDYDMPKPQHFVVESPVNNTKADLNIGEIGPTYRSGYNLLTYGNEVKSIVEATNVRYELVYNKGTNLKSKDDDFYEIQKVK